MRGHGHRLHRQWLLAFACTALVALFGTCMVAAGSAFASTTIGQTDPLANYPCGAEIDTQSAVSSGTGFVVPTGSWLLTSWNTYAGRSGGLMSLMIFRRTAQPFVYTVVAESPVQTLRPGVLNIFAANAVVQGGDLLGFWSGEGAACATFTGSLGDVNPYQFGGEPPVGSTVALSVAPAFRLNISATLKSPADLLADLLLAVTGKGPGTSLADKVALVQTYLAADESAAACATLGDFISEVAAQTGKHISAADAASFTAQATNIEALVGC